MDFSALPPDVVESILISLSDFKSLSAALRTSKRLIYNVFQAHPVSITRAIAYNLVGPALPLALRVVHLRYSHLKGTQVDDVPDEDQVMGRPLSRDIAQVLHENAEVAYGLEDLFSMRYKDKTSRTSQLTCKESAVFLEAFYRAWGMTDVVDNQLDDHNLYDEYDEEDDDDDNQRIQELYEALGEVLNVYDNKQLHELYDICLFLYQVARWVVGRDQAVYQAKPPGVFLCNPAFLWRAFREESSQSVLTFDTGGTNPMASSTLQVALERLWRNRKVNTDDYIKNQSKCILDNVEGENDTCDRCDKPAGLELWGPTNLDLWRRNMLPSSLSIAKFLPGLLSQNSLVTTCLQSFTYRHGYLAVVPAVDPLFFDTMADEIFAIARDQERDTCEWTRDKWYCTECIDELFNRYLWRWILAYKQKKGEIPQDDCWYGYHCRTMTHRPEHARKLNHLCVPTRGDAPYGHAA